MPGAGRALPTRLTTRFVSDHETDRRCFLIVVAAGVSRDRIMYVEIPRSFDALGAVIPVVYALGLRRRSSGTTSSGIARRMNLSNWGTVKAAYPCPGVWSRQMLISSARVRGEVLRSPAPSRVKVTWFRSLYEISIKRPKPCNAAARDRLRVRQWGDRAAGLAPAPPAPGFAL